MDPEIAPGTDGLVILNDVISHAELFTNCVVSLDNSDSIETSSTNHAKLVPELDPICVNLTQTFDLLDAMDVISNSTSSAFGLCCKFRNLLLLK